MEGTSNRSSNWYSASASMAKLFHLRFNFYYRTSLMQNIVCNTTTTSQKPNSAKCRQDSSAVWLKSLKVEEKFKSLTRVTLSGYCLNRRSVQESEQNRKWKNRTSIKQFRKEMAGSTKCRRISIISLGMIKVKIIMI